MVYLNDKGDDEISESKESDYDSSKDPSYVPGSSCDSSTTSSKGMPEDTLLTKMCLRTRAALPKKVNTKKVALKATKVKGPAIGVGASHNSSTCPSNGLSSSCSSRTTSSKSMSEETLGSRRCSRTGATLSEKVPKKKAALLAIKVKGPAIKEGAEHNNNTGSSNGLSSSCSSRTTSSKSMSEETLGSRRCSRTGATLSEKVPKKKVALLATKVKGPAIKVGTCDKSSTCSSNGLSSSCASSSTSLKSMPEETLGLRRCSRTGAARPEKVPKKKAALLATKIKSPAIKVGTCHKSSTCSSNGLSLSCASSSTSLKSMPEETIGLRRCSRTGAARPETVPKKKVASWAAKTKASAKKVATRASATSRRLVTSNYLMCTRCKTFSKVTIGICEPCISDIKRKSSVKENVSKRQKISPLKVRKNVPKAKTPGISTMLKALSEASEVSSTVSDLISSSRSGTKRKSTDLKDASKPPKSSKPNPPKKISKAKANISSITASKPVKTTVGVRTMKGKTKTNKAQVSAKVVECKSTKARIPAKKIASKTTIAKAN